MKAERQDDLRGHGPSVIDTPQRFSVSIGVVLVSIHRGHVKLRELLVRLTGLRPDRGWSNAEEK
jgi:hypothetical protein